MVVLIVLGVLWFFIGTDTESPQYELDGRSAVIIAKPQDIFSVDSVTSFDSKIKRTIFIEKIRNVLPDIVLTKNIKKEPIKSVEEDTDTSLIMRQQSNSDIEIKSSTSSQIDLNTKLSTSTIPLDVSLASTTNASSSTSTLEQLLE